MTKSSKKEVISKKKIIKNVYSILQGQIKERLLYDVATYAIAFLSESILNRKTVIINNFGTFSVKKSIQSDYEFYSAKFYPAPIVKKISKQKFLDKKKENNE